MPFFDTYIGGFVVQSIVHSVITLLIVEMSLRIWQVDEVRVRFRYRLLVIVLPFFMYPAFQLINPDRGSMYFVLDTAVFSTARWLGLELFGTLPLGFLFLLLVITVSVIVIFQEVIPIASDLFLRQGKTKINNRPAGKELSDIVDKMSKDLNIETPDVSVIDEESPVIYTTGTKKHVIVLSETLLQVFNSRQLRNAVAHELAHIVRRSNFTTLMVFMLRICMFYNPVSLLEFRRLVQDDEHICDDITVSITGDPEGLALTLRAFYLDLPHKADIKLTGIKDAIESSSHNLLLQERITRLENMRTLEHGAPGWGRYILTLTAIAIVNYFIV